MTLRKIKSCIKDSEARGKRGLATFIYDDGTWAIEFRRYKGIDDKWRCTFSVIKDTGFKENVYISECTVNTIGRHTTIESQYPIKRAVKNKITRIAKALIQSELMVA